MTATPPRRLARDLPQGDDATITVQVGGANGKRTLQRCTLQGDCEVVAPSRGRADPDIAEGEDPYFLSDN